MLLTKISNFFPSFSATDNGGDRQKKDIRQAVTGFPGLAIIGNDSNLLIVFYVQIMPDDFV
ncbi:hypothetical protein OA49_22400, partial [Escherichia coli]